MHGLRDGLLPGQADPETGTEASTKKYCATIPEEDYEGSSATVPRVNNGIPPESNGHPISRVSSAVVPSKDQKDSRVEIVDSDEVSPLS